MSILSAMTQDQIVANQLIEGNTDSSLFENFIYQTLLSLRNDPQTKEKEILLFMDNARIHHHSSVINTTKKFNVHLLFNAE